MNTMGKVTLLGAGPGDLDLLTMKAAKALAAADVLLLDDLVDPGIVALAPCARVIRVGKRGGCRSTPQAFIERLMCRYALRGAHVVRVKGGDVLLFGRAGEELAALRAARVPVEIVNGISSGFAAAASLGVSLTHRDHCQGVTFVTAHLQDHGEPDWASLAATGTTLAIYMGMSRIERIARDCCRRSTTRRPRPSSSGRARRPSGAGPARSGALHPAPPKRGSAARP
ncbi:uroporphyrinogen-III C-methyltransferase [Burkholderia pseudomallei MSHR4032]|nr:uroporphyrinogen-III C-methyltransferase [Burkholderia pseudomallei MSHR4032]